MNSSTETSKITKNASSDVNDSCLIAAENAANIVMSIDRKNVRALVTVSLMDFSLDGIPELVISYDVGNGNSFVENDVYDLQSGNNESVFCFVRREYQENMRKACFYMKILRLKNSTLLFMGLIRGII